MKIIYTFFFLFLLSLSLFGQNAGISSVGSYTACPGTVVTIPVYVLHSPPVMGISLEIDYSAAVLSALQTGNTATFLSNINAPLLPVTAWAYAQTAKTGNISMKQLRVGTALSSAVYLDTNSSGLAKLFDIRFRYFGGTTSMAFDNSSSGGGNCEYTDASGNALTDKPNATYYISGLMTECSSGISIQNPTSFSFSNYPNPFNTSTTLNFDLPETGTINISVYNIFGEVISTPVKGSYPNGKYYVPADLSKFPNGIYFCRMTYNSGGKDISKTTILNKVR